VACYDLRRPTNIQAPALVDIQRPHPVDGGIITAAEALIHTLGAKLFYLFYYVFHKVRYFYGRGVKIYSQYTHRLISVDKLCLSSGEIVCGFTYSA
jgi:hypothetical protein